MASKRAKESSSIKYRSAYSEIFTTYHKSAEEVIKCADDMHKRIDIKAGNEFKAAMEQLQSGAEQISCVIQSNATTAEETYATSEELSTQANALKEMRRFLMIVIKYRYRFKCTYPDKRVTTGNYVLF